MAISTRDPDVGTARIPFSAKLAAAGLLLGSAGNLAQTVLWQVAGGRPETVDGQIAWADAHAAHFVVTALAGTLAVPFMAVGFVAAARLLAARARRTGIVAGVLLVLGMWGFQVIQAAETVQLAAMLDGDGHDAARWLDGLAEQPLLLVFGVPFLLGAPLGLLVLTIGTLITGAVPRWIAVSWLAFVLLDFSVGAVGPVDPHWLYFAGAVGLAAYLLRDRGHAWANA
jgi:hypothetical protein